MSIFAVPNGRFFRAEYTGEMPEWSIGPHSKCGVRATVPGVRIPLSPLNVLDRNGSANGQKATNQDLWLFYCPKSCFQDFKSTVKDKVSLLNRYLFPAGQKR